MRKQRMATCHPDRLHSAKELCKTCYNIQYLEQPENRARLKEYYVQYRARPEVQNRVKARTAQPRIKAQKKAYDARPSSKVLKFLRRYPKCKMFGEQLLALYMISPNDRLCFLCGNSGEGIVHMHHNHDTGEVLGWTHSRCNINEGFVPAIVSMLRDRRSNGLSDLPGWPILP